jgi:type I restriction enzyme R subunit
VAEQGTPSSKADMIASLTKRTITERMEEDPVYFKRISDLIEQAIVDHKAERISDLEFLNCMREAREQVVRLQHDDVPDRIRDNDTAVAFFQLLEKELGAAGATANNGNGMREVAAEAADEFYRIIERHRVVNWTQREDIQNDMRNDIDDYLFDIVRDKKGTAVSVEVVDQIVDRVIAIARARLAA